MKFKIIEKLSSGGASEVYLAEASDGGRVALKVLRTTRDSDREEFEKQVRLLVRLRHPSVVPVLGYLSRSAEIFGTEQGPCFWMEYVEGEDLITASRGNNPEAIFKWFRESIEALRFLHGQGVIHGDLSPQNIRIDPEGRLRLLDFSILPGDAASADTTTLPYMAPERIDGTILSASDLFSLGTIFYEAIAGRHPRAGCRTVQELIRFRPRPLGQAAPRLTANQLETRIIDRMICSDLRERFGSADSIWKALQGAGAEEPSESFGEIAPLSMLGAEEGFDTISKILATLHKRSVAVAVHGPAGVGKSRFIREIGFEAAIRGIRVQEFSDLHLAGTEELGRVLTILRSLPPAGTIAVLQWNDDKLTDAAGRFCGTLLAEGLARDIPLKNLSRENSQGLVEGFLQKEAAREFTDATFEQTGGNPKRIIESLRKLAAAGLVRQRTLLKGWCEKVREPRTPLPLAELRIRGLSMAERFWEGGRSTEALETIEAALTVVNDPAERSRLLRLKTNVLNDLGRYEEALPVCDDWFALKADDEPLPLKTVKYWFITGWGHQNLGRDDEASRRFRQSLEAGEPYREDPEIASLLARAHSQLGRSLVRGGDPSAAIAEFEASLNLLPDENSARAETYRNLATALSKSGHAKRAEDSLEKAEALYRKLGNKEGLFWSLLQAGNLGLNKRNFESTETAYSKAEAIAQETKSDLRLAIVWNNRGLLARERGDLALALDLLHKARDTLRFLGNANDIAYNLKELVVAEASVGHWTKAASFLKELVAMGRSFEGATAFSKDAETALHSLREGKTEETAESLQSLYSNLPAELQVTFVDRGDYRRLFPEAGTAARTREVPMPFILSAGEVFTTLARLNEELLTEDEIPKVLTRLMDSAMKIARAESGFLILQSDVPGGPLPGYQVAIAQNITKEEIATDIYAFSLSAIRRALQTEETVVTDNALLDPLFREARSVHLRQLKSIVALPVKSPDGILGVFYLDHRFEEGLFEGEILEALKAFAGVASLALQKGRMIEALQKNNRELSERVRVQTREINRSRLVLKNEYSDIIGRSPKMVEVLSMADRITDSIIPVWIYGESGTGKEAIARALHFNSARAKKPFVTENCSALPENLLESELFGHKKGSFTHALADKKGILQYSDGGTIFLDEIADMSPPLQAKLLRFLENGEIRPIGSPEVIRVDVRVVSASNKDLPALVAEGKFREDLFYRLNGVTLRLPPLRDRMEDLPLLTEHFLKKISERERKEPARLEATALRLFLNYSWPGNVRELKNTIETAVLFAEEGMITPRSLQFKPAILEGRPPIAVVSMSAAPVATLTPKPPVDPVLAETLRSIRDHCYHKGMAAKALGITRRALYARLRKFGIATDVTTIRTNIERFLD